MVDTCWEHLCGNKNHDVIEIIITHIIPNLDDSALRVNHNCAMNLSKNTTVINFMTENSQIYIVNNKFVKYLIFDYFFISLFYYI